MVQGQSSLWSDVFKALSLRCWVNEQMKSAGLQRILLLCQGLPGFPVLQIQRYQVSFGPLAI